MLQEMLPRILTHSAKTKDCDLNGNYWTPGSVQPISRQSRRDDLQGVRGWAVLAVLVFHFAPSLLPYGFLGVDVFFVLSGFLITMVLSNSDGQASSSFTIFYGRRVKRIFPLYLLVVTICLLVVVLVFDNPELLFYNTRSAIRALTFSTNLKGDSREEEYFRQVVASHDLFTHTWSLAVEVQFYLLAPFLLFPVKCQSAKTGACLAYLVSIAAASFLYHIFSSENTSFNSVFSRIWQFTIGSIAYNVYRSNEVPHGNVTQKSKNRFILLLGAGVIFIPLAASALFSLNTIPLLRTSVTLLTGVLISSERKSGFLTNRAIAYVGDCSYALYLVHWPVYALLVHYDALGAHDIVLAMVSCIILAALVHEICEVRYLRLGVTNIVIIIVTMYSTSAAILLCANGDVVLPNVMTSAGTDKTGQGLPELATEPHQVVPDSLRLWKTANYRNLSINDAISVNADYEAKWYENLRYPNCTHIEGPADPFGLTECDEGSGRYNFLLMGNSYTANLGRLVQKHFRQHYKRFMMFAVDSCEALIDISIYEPCDHLVYLETLKKVKPDILFIIQRFLNPAKALEDPDVEKDDIYKEILRDLETYAPFVKKIFVLNALPRPRGGVFFKKIAQFLGSIPLTDVQVNQGGTTEDAWPMRARMAEVARKCSNCFVYDFYRQHVLADNSTFMVTASLVLNKQQAVIDPRNKVMLFERTLHYTPYGLLLIEPVYQRLSEHFEEYLEARHPNNVLE